MRIVDVCGLYTRFGGGIRTYVEQKLAMAERFAAILALPQRFVARSPSMTVRSIADHFAELFALYERIWAERQVQVA